MIEKQQEKAIATKKENLPAQFDLESMADKVKSLQQLEIKNFQC